MQREITTEEKEIENLKEITTEEKETENLQVLLEEKEHKINILEETESKNETTISVLKEKIENYNNEKDNPNKLN